MSERHDIIRASEVGRYAYCARAWWFGRVQGLPSAQRAAMRRGIIGHRVHGRAVERTVRLRRLARVLLSLAAAALLAFLILSLAR